MNTAVQQQHRTAIYVPSDPLARKDPLTIDDEDLLVAGAEDFDTIRDLRLYIELPNDTTVELHEATTKPGVWKATVTIGADMYLTTVHCLHGRLREVWGVRNRARNREALRRRHTSREGTPASQVA